MRIAVVGAGAVGGTFGARLAMGGEEVAFVARGEHLRAIRNHGFRLEGPDGEHRVSVQAFGNSAEIGPVDVVILAVKTWQLEETTPALMPLLGPETCVLPLQNGLEATGQLGALLGFERIVGGLCRTISWLVVPGHIRSLAKQHSITVGELDGTSSERCARLKDAFGRAQVGVEIASDIEAALWEKFLFVVPLGGVGAVTRVPIGVFRRIPETRQLLGRAINEILDLSRVHGIRLADDAAERCWRGIDSLPPTAISSLQRDFESAKRTELDAWSGAVVRLGRAAGIETPSHDFLFRCLLPLELAARAR